MVFAMLLCCIASVLVLTCLLLVLVALQADAAMHIAAEINDETQLLRVWYGKDKDVESKEELK